MGMESLKGKYISKKGTTGNPNDTTNKPELLWNFFPIDKKIPWLYRIAAGPEKKKKSWGIVQLVQQ